MILTVNISITFTRKPITKYLFSFFLLFQFYIKVNASVEIVGSDTSRVKIQEHQFKPSSSIPEASYKGQKHEIKSEKPSRQMLGNPSEQPSIRTNNINHTEDNNVLFEAPISLDMNQVTNEVRHQIQKNKDNHDDIMKGIILVYTAKCTSCQIPDDLAKYFKSLYSTNDYLGSEFIKPGWVKLKFDSRFNSEDIDDLLFRFGVVCDLQDEKFEVQK